MQAAVLRATGSAKNALSGNHGNASRVTPTSDVPVAMNARSGGHSSSMRRAVSAMSGSFLPGPIASTCLGRWVREAGQKRVPLPPAKIRANAWDISGLLGQVGQGLLERFERGTLLLFELAAARAHLQNGVLGLVTPRTQGGA